MRRALAIAACLLLACGVARAQQPAVPTPSTPAGAPETYTFQQFSRLVILDVLVTDSKGNPVPGLERRDFHITEGKEPQTLLDFQPPAAVSPTADLVINSTADLDRLAPNAPVNIILLDEFNTRFEDMAFARYSLRKYLERQPGKLASPTMLVAVSLQKFVVLSDYTQNKDQLLHALDHHFAVYPWQLQHFAWVSERFAAAFYALSRVAEATVGHPGHKNMIWIGRGFPSLNFSRLTVDSTDRVDNAVQVCINELRDARITLFTIDPAGVMIHPDEYGSTMPSDLSMPSDPFGGNYTFNKLAQATGGRALFGRNDVDAEIGTTIRDGRSLYSLTYRPTNSSTDPQKFRRIQVTLPDHPGLRITTREGYYLQRRPTRVDPSRPTRVVADLRNAGTTNLVYDGVPLTLTPVPNDPDSFQIFIPGKDLVWSPAHDDVPRQAEIIVTSTVFDKKGRELAHDAKLIRVGATGPAIPPSGPIDHSITVRYHLKRAPKATRARFVIRVNSTGRIGTADTDLTAASATP